MSAEWHRVCPSEALALDTLQGTEVEGRAVVVTRTDTGLSAFDDACPHRGAAFTSVGRIMNGKLLCGWHYWAFDCDTGAHTNITGVCLKTHAVREHDGWVEVSVTPP